MPESLPPAELAFSPLLTRLYVSLSTFHYLSGLTIALLLLDSLQNATKKMLCSDSVANILLHQCCVAP
jgi:hypothetical protein